MTGAEVLVKCLEKEGVELLFGYPGVAICPFFDALLDTQIRPVLVREEQNAAHAASGYARMTGNCGVVAVTSGPGATNLITGIATAFADSIPLVCFTGQVESHLLGNDVFQEADISGACESFVKYSYIVRSAADIPQIIKEAFYIAGSGRKGPVLIDLPMDIQLEEVQRFSYPKELSMRTYKPTVKGNGAQIKRVISQLKDARRPIMCVGGGVHLSGAEAEIRRFAEAHQIPVVSTMMGIGVMPTEHPLYFGMVGNNGHVYGNRAMNEADLIMMVGARVADRSISQPDLIMTGKIMIHIDVDPAEIGKIAGPNTPLVGDIRTIFREMEKHEIQTTTSAWLRTLQGYKTDGADREVRNRRSRSIKGKTLADPALFLRELSLAMKKDAIVTVDVGQNQMWACANYVVRDGSFLTSGGMGTMGYALPAAMGAKLACPKKQVVAVCGDGGFQMTMMELGTMEQYGIPAKVVILKNRTLGLVYQYQKLRFKKRYIVTELGDTPDFEKLA
ncbi:MAG: biosynthetic-type acetolactate synthase large subunit, partial [Lachnospiraceae bacterium]|nr:biosynthetic-type acetolactate synthase large subunit [Lachnospiraceae bacterium]